MMYSIFIPFLICAMWSVPHPAVGFGGESVECQSQAAFSIHFVVDRMVHHKQLGVSSPEQPWLSEPLAERYSLTYQVEESGDFFLEIIPLLSPWGNGHQGMETWQGVSDAQRILITQEGFSVVGQDGSTIFSQDIGGLSWPEGFFSSRDNPWKFRELLLMSNSIEVTRDLIESAGAIILPDGTLSLQSCGQSGPIRMLCQPGICTRLIFDPLHLRPIMAEHSLAGEDPFYCRYYRWSDDGSALEKTFEWEKVTLPDGTDIFTESVSHFYDFSIKILN